MAKAPREPASKTSTVGRRWRVRLLAAIALGVVLGGIIGVVGVRTLEPGRPGDPDSLQMLLDSIAKAKAAAELPVVAPQAAVDTTPDEPPPPVVIAAVPALTDFEEGEARELLEDLGFTVGTILFRSSSKATGTVLSTFPVAGERIVLPATVNLILSDGRGPRDSLDTPGHLSR
jgi:hypothetical protein